MIKKKVVVTGGLGFIASNLIEKLLKQNYKVINIDKVTYSSNFYNTQDYKKNSNYTFVKCDLNDKIKLNKNFYAFTGSTVGVVPILGKGIYTGKIEKLGNVKAIIKY